MCRTLLSPPLSWTWISLDTNPAGNTTLKVWTDDGWLYVRDVCAWMCIYLLLSLIKLFDSHLYLVDAAELGSTNADIKISCVI